MRLRFAFVLTACLVAGCSSSTDATDTSTPPTSTPAGDAPVPELGNDGERGLVVVGTQADGLATPRALAFDPANPDRLWVVNAGLGGVVIYQGMDGATPTAERRTDIFAGHFMSDPSSIAFGAEGTFASCPESRDGWNGAPQPEDDFMGPTLWSADLGVFATVNQARGTGKEGSHIDMLHESPLCMGIAWEADNVYWTFDGLDGHVVRYDFRKDHGPGGTNHSDGVVRRFPDAKVTRVRGVHAGMAFDGDTGLLYVADTGGGRIVVLDTTTGTSSKLTQDVEPLAEYSKMSGATVTAIAEGLHEPSGLVLRKGRLFVSEHASGDIVALDLQGKELARAKTGAKGLMGLAFDAGGRLHAVDAAASRIVRVDPKRDPSLTDRADGTLPPSTTSCAALENDAPDVVEERVPSARPSATTGGALRDGKYHLTSITTFTGPAGDAGKGKFARRETYRVTAGKITGVQRNLGGFEGLASDPVDEHLVHEAGRAMRRRGERSVAHARPCHDHVRVVVVEAHGGVGRVEGRAAKRGSAFVACLTKLEGHTIGQLTCAPGGDLLARSTSLLGTARALAASTRRRSPWFNADPFVRTAGMPCQGQWRPPLGHPFGAPTRPPETPTPPLN